MAEFCEVMKQAKRMCNTLNKSCGDCCSCVYEHTDNCPIETVHDCSGSDFEEMENIVMQWAAEHPEPSASTPAPSDPIHHPTHYNADGGMECIEEMLLVFGREAVMHFCACNVWKYRYRANGKDGEKDLQKAHEYMRIYERLKQEGGAVG